MFVPFYCDIPRVPLSHIAGIPMTGQSISYILGLQAASSLPESIIAALSGLIAGILWRMNILHMQSVLKIPECVARFCNAKLGRLLHTGATVQHNTTHIDATLEIQRQDAMERLEQQVIWRSVQNSGNAGGPQVQNLINGPGIFGVGNNNGWGQRLEGEEGELLDGEIEEIEDPEVSEEQVQQMVEMGFNQEQVRHALHVSNNDVSMATNFLLQQTL